MREFTLGSVHIGRIGSWPLGQYQPRALLSLGILP